VPVVDPLFTVAERQALGGFLSGYGGLTRDAYTLDLPLRDVQEAASHADPRTTMRYDRARASLDRHAT
jgi:hypothetical protein